MSDDISSVPLTHLVNACNEQTEHFKHNKPFDARYCLEIFRRGIVTHDDAAWEALYAIYTTVVKNWLLRSARTLVELARQHSDTAVDDAIQDGFVQFYLQFSSQKLRFADFDLPGLIRYLEKCAWSALKNRTKTEYTYSLVGEHVDQHALPDDAVLRHMQAIVLLDAIRQRLTSQEWRLLELRYAENMKTSEAAARIGIPVQEAYRLLPKLRQALASDQHLSLLYKRWTNPE
jgi:RNA polymerase sigma factor (sigma-70 family)